ncbi:MAG TPA: serine hydrolase domain-containing protein [Thermoanaerobaculia bacterium]|nr:serine hydrolase domain-containing protein [Thermoanaerobaculia bacterium]
MILLVCAAAVVANASSPPAERIDTRVVEYVDAGLFSGVVLVSKGDTIVYQKAFGYAERAFKVPNTMETKFHIASVSKPITAAAILLLADRGKLSLDDPVSKFVPDFPNGGRIAVEELLTHYSGLADASSQPDYNDWSRFPQTPSSLVEKLAKLPPRSEPGTKYAYSNSNYHLLALIVEKASGKNYGDFLDANLFGPLAMTRTAHHADDRTIIDRLAAGYMPKDADAFEKAPYLDWTSKTGNGSLYTTAGDLLKFHRALQHGNLLKPETVAASYGFGRKERQVGMFWFRRERDGHRSVYVGGSSPGFKAHIERFIDDDVAVIVLSNLYLASATPIASDISAILWQAAPKLPPVPKAVARSRDDLARVAGSYQFGPDFYQRNVMARIEPRENFLMMVYPTFSAPLTPIANDQYFDRFYWSFVRFEDGKLSYRNGDDEFVAPRINADSNRSGTGAIR